MNYIRHKCPVCGYETDIDYISNDIERTKGDEDFVVIKGFHDSRFPTDVKVVDYGYREDKTVTLLGCPKCNVVTYKM